MKGVEFLRKLHANAGFSIRPQARNGKVDLLKEMVESIVASRDEVREALQSLVQPQDPCYTTSAKGLVGPPGFEPGTVRFLPGDLL